MKKQIILFSLLGFSLPVVVIGQQKPEKFIYRGNEFYRKQEYDKSLKEYEQALKNDPKNSSANFNRGNANFRKQQYAEAAESFSTVIATAADPPMKQQGYYNQGVAMIRQNKLEESIESWKNALKLDPSDTLARENLQKALRELKKKQQQQQQQQQNKKNQQDKQQDQKPPPQSKLSKKQVEQLLKALQQKEKEVQDRLQKDKVASPRKPEKDW